MTERGQQGKLCSDAKGLHLDCGMGYTGVDVNQESSNYTLKTGAYYCRIYFDKMPFLLGSCEDE